MITKFTYTGQSLSLGNEVVNCNIYILDNSFRVVAFDDGYIYADKEFNDIKKAIDYAIKSYADMLEFIAKQ